MPDTDEAIPTPKRGWLRPESISNWIATATALISLAISLYTLVITTNEPEVTLMMPNQVRITQGGNSGPLLYLQPMFISTGLSERVEVVTEIRMEVAATKGTTSPTQFVWDEMGQWVADPNTMMFNWTFTGDAGPFLVSAREAQFFTGLFIGPRDWFFEAGTYEVTVTADRISGAQQLVGSVRVTLNEEQIAFINNSQGQQFLIFPVEK
jgi:hypothetical protein